MPQQGPTSRRFPGKGHLPAARLAAGRPLGEVSLPGQAAQGARAGGGGLLPQTLGLETQVAESTSARETGAFPSLAEVSLAGGTGLWAMKRAHTPCCTEQAFRAVPGPLGHSSFRSFGSTARSRSAPCTCGFLLLPAAPTGHCYRPLTYLLFSFVKPHRHEHAHRLSYPLPFLLPFCCPLLLLLPTAIKCAAGCLDLTK